MLRRFVVSVAVVLGLQLLAAAVPPCGEDTRDQRRKHLRELMVAMHNYHTDFQRLPRAIVFSEDNKPLLSWRVALLPYLGHDRLYKRFKLDEPWDSTNNKKLVEEMPDVFTVPGAPDPGKGMTYLQVFTAPDKVPAGKKDVFRPLFRTGPTRGVTLGQLTVQDGTSNTLGIAESAKAVVWTKPEDMVIEHDAAPLPKLGCVAGEDDFGGVFFDGSVRFIRRSLRDQQEYEKLLRQIIGYKDGSNFDTSPIVKENKQDRDR